MLIELLEFAKVDPGRRLPAAQNGEGIGADDTVLLLLCRPPTHGHLPVAVVPAKNIRNGLGARLNKLLGNL